MKHHAYVYIHFYIYVRFALLDCCFSMLAAMQERNGKCDRIYRDSGYLYLFI